MLPRLASRCFHTVSQFRAEFGAPVSDRLVGHNHPALEEQFFDIAQAQLETKVPTHRATDDARRETVTVIQRFRSLHQAILPDSITQLGQQPDNAFRKAIGLPNDLNVQFLTFGVVTLNVQRETARGREAFAS
jgi:hypothetical protein